MACLENWNLNYAKRSCSIQFKITTIKKKASSMFNRHGSFSVLVRGCLIILASHFQQHILEQFMFSLVLVFAEYFFSFSSICAPSLFVRTGSAYLTCNSHSTKRSKTVLNTQVWQWGHYCQPSITHEECVPPARRPQAVLSQPHVPLSFQIDM